MSFHRLKKDSTELATYFSIGSCMEGLSKLFKSLFDVTLESVEPDFGELWSHDVHKLVSYQGMQCNWFERSNLKLNSFSLMLLVHNVETIHDLCLLLML